MNIPTVRVQAELSRLEIEALRSVLATARRKAVPGSTAYRLLHRVWVAVERAHLKMADEEHRIGPMETGDAEPSLNGTPEPQGD